MIIHKELLKFVVLPTEPILSALGKIEHNKHKLVYVVDSRNFLLGSLSDGDFRRWLLENKQIDAQCKVADIYNPNCLQLPVDTPYSDLQQQLNELNYSIPLIDQEGHFVALAEQGAKFVEIENRRISNEDPAFIIAEIGNNHQGDLSLAKQLVDIAKAANVDCVKFQMRNMDTLYGDYHANHDSQDLGSQYTLDLLKKYQLQNNQLFELFDYARSQQLIPLCTPWDADSLTQLEAYGMSAYKVASADLTNFPLLERISETGKPMICSTGMSTEDEIRDAVQFLERQKAQFILLHCNSTYPTPYKDVNLSYLPKLKALSRDIVGYSGHERGYCIPVAAVALGAKVIEKHITTNKELEGNDHIVSLLPDELKDMVDAIRATEQALSGEHSRSLTQGEMMNREILAKSIVASRNIEQGEQITQEHLAFQSPGNGIQPNRANELIGKVMHRDIQQGQCFFESDINPHSNRKARYQYHRPYGIPVRFHDFTRLTQDVEMDFVEFHFSHDDLNLDPDEYLGESSIKRFATHAPELFANDHLLDLSATDSTYREQSIANLQRVINVTRSMKSAFPDTDSPVIVVNAGGWDRTQFLTEQECAHKYALVRDSLSQLDTEGVTLAIQTMPPFPWHFGGQSHHNLFVHAEDIATFCQEFGEQRNIKICLDLSHSMMACQFYQTDILDFIATVAPFVAHLHISDAKGVDGEGVKMGHGDINFDQVGRQFLKTCPNVPFIPEIWQGHTNQGEGFWQALSYLENKL